MNSLLSNLKSYVNSLYVEKFPKQRFNIYDVCNQVNKITKQKIAYNKICLMIYDDELVKECLPLFNGQEQNSIILSYTLPEMDKVSLNYNIKMIIDGPHNAIIEKYILEECGSKTIECGGYVLSNKRVIEHHIAQFSFGLVKPHTDFPAPLTSLYNVKRLRFGREIGIEMNLYTSHSPMYSNQYIVINIQYDERHQNIAINEMCNLEVYFNNPDKYRLVDPQTPHKTIIQKMKNDHMDQKLYWYDKLSNFDNAKYLIPNGRIQFSNIFDLGEFCEKMTFESEFTTKFGGNYLFYLLNEKIPEVYEPVEFFRTVNHVGKLKYRQDIIISDGNVVDYAPKGSAFKTKPNVKSTYLEKENGNVSYKEALEVDLKMDGILLKTPLSQFPSKKLFIKHSLVKWYEYNYDGKYYKFSVTLCKKISDFDNTLSSNLEFEFPNIDDEQKVIYASMLSDIFLSNYHLFKNVKPKL